MVPDIENFVFNTVATALRDEFDGIFVAGEQVAAPASFPAVTLIEMDNSAYARTRDIAGTENHSTIMYEVNCYSNLSSGKKAQCKAIMALIDTEMQKLGFVRIGCGPMEMTNRDTAKYRMVARFRAVVSKTGAIYKIV